VRKGGTGPLGTTPTLFTYDESGQLLGEYNDNGLAKAEFVYLDSLPIAMIKGTTVLYVETDHLGTPRQLVDAANNVQWAWNFLGSAFGTQAPTTTTYPMNLRFPGQYYDAETGLNYNYFRDYEPTTGRYVESDPIGLKAGPTTYGYVRANPITFIDPLGLLCTYSQSTGDFKCKAPAPWAPQPSDGSQCNTCDVEYYHETGYSGTGGGRNNPDSQGEPNTGPIPSGFWQTTGTWHNSRNTGRNTINLAPLPSPTYGNLCPITTRDCSSFRIHGNNSRNDASEGCIVLPPNRINIPPGETVYVTE
jgi:RHS repeat-associated protein